VSRKAKKKIRDEEKIQKHIEKYEKKALRLSGVDEGLVQRFWELVNLFPRISTIELERRVERFILNATPGQFFAMQTAIFKEATPYLVEDPRVRGVLEALSGKKIGLAVVGEYESTVCLSNCCFSIERGIREDVPVISIASRQDYVDAILQRKDPLKMIFGRKIRASHKLKLLRWALPHIDLIRDKHLFDKYLSYQNEVEKILDEQLARMGY